MKKKRDRPSKLKDDILHSTRILRSGTLSPKQRYIAEKELQERVKLLKDYGTDMEEREIASRLEKFLGRKDCYAIAKTMDLLNQRLMNAVKRERMATRAYLHQQQQMILKHSKRIKVTPGDDSATIRAMAELPLPDATIARKKEELVPSWTDEKTVESLFAGIEKPRKLYFPPPAQAKAMTQMKRHRRRARQPMRKRGLSLSKSMPMPFKRTKTTR
jgi:hypothetical protein